MKLYWVNWKKLKWMAIPIANILEHNSNDKQVVPLKLYTYFFTHNKKLSYHVSFSSLKPFSLQNSKKVKTYILTGESGQMWDVLFGWVWQLVLSPAVVRLHDAGVWPQHPYCLNVRLLESRDLFHVHLPHQQGIFLREEERKQHFSFLLSNRFLLQ